MVRLALSYDRPLEAALYREPPDAAFLNIRQVKKPATAASPNTTAGWRLVRSDAPRSS